MWRLLRDTCYEFSEDECPRSAAALAYYAIFSLPALLVLIVTITSAFADRAEVMQRIGDFLREFSGRRVAEQILALLKQTDRHGSGWQSAVGLVMLLIGATGVLSELQTALNRAWQVAPDPKQGGVKAFFVKRLLSLLMVAAMSLLLLASLILSWFLAAIGTWAEGMSFAWLSSPLLQVLEHLLSLAILTLLFAATFRFLPDARLDWSDVALGGLITALLFVLGKTLLSWYLAWADPTTAFGTAGSLALVLVWIYYSAMIYLFGAEFTHVYARSFGKQVTPEQGAMRQQSRRWVQSAIRVTDWQHARTGDG
jgi:membrane protein